MKRTAIFFLSVAAVSLASSARSEGLLHSNPERYATAMVLAPTLPPSAPLDQVAVELLPPGLFDVRAEMLLAPRSGTDMNAPSEVQVQGHWDKNLDRIVFSLPPGLNPSALLIQRMNVILRYFNGTMERYNVPAPRPLQPSIQLGEMRPS